MIITTIEYNFRRALGGFLELLIRLIKKTNFSDNLNLIQKLKKIKSNIYVNMFDSKIVLSYVEMKKIGVEKNASSITTIALGSSHADFAFFSPLWPNSYNLGLTSSDLYTAYFLYKNYRKKLTSINNIILFYSVFTPGNSLLYTSEKYRAVGYKYFFNIPYAEPSMIKRRFEKIVLRKCEIVNNEGGGEVHPSYSGYDKKDEIKSITSMASTIIRSKTHLRENRREPDQLIWLQKLNKCINEDNRKLVLVITPFRSDYKAQLPPKAELFKKIYNLKLQSSLLLDFYDSDLFTDEDMGDTDHMNEQGARKLTLEIKRILAEKELL